MQPRCLALALVFASAALVLSCAASAAAEVSFEGTRALRHLEELVEIGNRHYGAADRESAIAALAQMLKAGSEKVYIQRFQARERVSGAEYPLANLVARRNPALEQRILLGSHFDTRLWAEEDADSKLRGMPIQGANDGTSGVAVLIELLRAVETDPVLRGVGLDVVLFDGEEFGRPGSRDYCQGSDFFVRNLRQTYPTHLPIGAIVIDMVGDKALGIRREKSSNSGVSRWLTDAVWEAGKGAAPSVFLDETISVIVDDHSAFQRAGVPATLVIDLEYPHWHTHQDTLDKVSAASLHAVGTALQLALRDIARTHLAHPSTDAASGGDFD